MACGKLVKILLHSKVTRYLEFKSVDGSYVFKDGKVQKVPATPTEALNSSLMGFFEKRKFRNFLNFLSVYDKDKPSTYLKGKSQKLWIFSWFKILNRPVLSFLGQFLLVFHFTKNHTWNLCKIERSLWMIVMLKIQSVLAGKPLSKITMRQLYEEYGLDANTQAFTGEMRQRVQQTYRRKGGKRRDKSCKRDTGGGESRWVEGKKRMWEERRGSKD
jgi:GDP dissociation inhibitor